MYGILLLFCVLALLPVGCWRFADLRWRHRNDRQRSPAARLQAEVDSQFCWIVGYVLAGITLAINLAVARFS
jgi:hypothetical protein